MLVAVCFKLSIANVDELDKLFVLFICIIIIDMIKAVISIGTERRLMLYFDARPNTGYPFCNIE